MANRSSRRISLLSSLFLATTICTINVSSFTTVTLVNGCRTKPCFQTSSILSCTSPPAGEQISTLKGDLFAMLDTIPANAPTSSDMTERLLTIVRQLEETTCSSSYDNNVEGTDSSRIRYDDIQNDDGNDEADDEEFLNQIAGTWELLWTTQDRSSSQFNEQQFWKTFINPLENQSYSNNPSGRLNPVLPRPIQDQLESMGIISTDDNGDLKNIFRSIQSIDLGRRRVRNVVTFSVPSISMIPGNERKPGGSSRRASLIVDIDFTPDPTNSRRINVKFQSCRVVVPDTPIDIVLPLGFVGPTGWLETNYVDEELRITRGHKGSVFVLKRPSVSRVR